MTKKRGQFSRDYLLKLREFYISSPSISLAGLAIRSKELFGQEISYDRLKVYARTDGDGHWKVLRNARQEGSPASTGEEVENVRRVLYASLVASSEDALLITGDFDEDEIRRVVKRMKGAKVVRFGSRPVDSSLVNAYMNLLSKTNEDLKRPGGSAKTSRQKAIELIRQAKGGNG